VCALKFNPLHTHKTTALHLLVRIADMNTITLLPPVGGISPQGENGYAHFSIGIYAIIRDSKVNYPYIPKTKRIYS
jgi:hypothetical protein